MARTITATRSAVDVEQSLALIEKGQQMAGHFPDAEDMDRARRVLTGELSPEDARAEVRDALARLSERARARTVGCA